MRGNADQLFTSPRGQYPQLSVNAYVAGALKLDLESRRLKLEGVLTSWAAELGGLTPNTNLTQATIDGWRADIATARTNVNTAIANATAAQTSLKTAEADLNTEKGDLAAAEDQLAVKKSPARATDRALYEAEIRQAEAGMRNILAQLARRQILSPIGGVVTVVNAKVGSIAAASETAVSVISADALQIESYVPEINISYVKVGNSASVVLDAYGAETPFPARVISVDPAETIRDGVSTYRIKLGFINPDGRIKSGMTASILITTEKKSGVIAVPQGIVIRRDGKKFVLVRQGNAVREREIQTGSVSSLGQIEVVSGLADGDIVIVKTFAE
ncbi:MAG: efflux RND transporter periplasmic adaptor subunit [Candidatus Sungbacteria bacterium]|nr:efflux RND transporter periplasmic adaptor subunit [Candidatus Sungbacteria bacterium]